MIGGFSFPKIRARFHVVVGTVWFVVYGFGLLGGGGGRGQSDSSCSTHQHATKVSGSGLERYNELVMQRRISSYVRWVPGTCMRHMCHYQIFYFEVFSVRLVCLLASFPHIPKVPRPSPLCIVSGCAWGSGTMLLRNPNVLEAEDLKSKLSMHESRPINVRRDVSNHSLVKCVVSLRV